MNIFGSAELRCYGMRGGPEERTKEAIGRRIKATRIALGLNQRELCRRASIATNTYNQWEKGWGRPDLDEAIKLVDAFDLTLDWIYLGNAARLPYEIAQAVLNANMSSPDPDV